MDSNQQEAEGNIVEPFLADPAQSLQKMVTEEETFMKF